MSSFSSSLAKTQNFARLLSAVSLAIIAGFVGASYLWPRQVSLPATYPYLTTHPYYRNIVFGEEIPLLSGILTESASSAAEAIKQTESLRQSAESLKPVSFVRNARQSVETWAALPQTIANASVQNSFGSLVCGRWRTDGWDDLFKSLSIKPFYNPCRHAPRRNLGPQEAEDLLFKIGTKAHLAKQQKEQRIFRQGIHREATRTSFRLSTETINEVLPSIAERQKEAVDAGGDSVAEQLHTLEKLFVIQNRLLGQVVLLLAKEQQVQASSNILTLPYLDTPQTSQTP